MEYKLISVLGYDEFRSAMRGHFNDGWNLWMNVVITPTYRTEVINMESKRIDYEMYTQWIMRSKDYGLKDNKS